MLGYLVRSWSDTLKKARRNPYLRSVMQATPGIECCFTILAWLTCWHLIGFSRLVEQWTTFERHRAVYWARYSWSSCVELKDVGKCPDTKQEPLLDKGYIPLCSVLVMALSFLFFPRPFSPHIREYKTVLDSTLKIPDSRNWPPILCRLNLDSGFHSLVGFRIP